MIFLHSTFFTNSFSGECGQLGLGDYQMRVAPVPVDSLRDEGKAVFAAAGFAHTLVHMDSGKTFGFGWNESGALGIHLFFMLTNIPLGIGNTENQSTPKSVQLWAKPTQISCGRLHTLCLLGTILTSLSN